MTFPSERAEKFIVRFDQPGHRERLKKLAVEAKRSLNKQILVLIEAGEKAVAKSQDAKP